MALKPSGGNCKIREQIIEDPVSGLTLQFELRDDGSTQLRIVGNIPFGNRDFVFDDTGAEVGAGVSVAGTCRPTWIREVG